MASATWRFEATCTCGGRITGNGVSRPWRHDIKPADRRHYAMPTDVLRQI